MRTIVLALSASLVGAVACHDSTAPHRELRAIYEIRVPASAAASDSIHIQFEARTGYCDNNVMVSSTMDATSMRFAITSEPGSGNCPPGVYISPKYSYVVVPPHSVPFTVHFVEPGAADSVRVVNSP
ncbi:MAG TPA: hypothetical protein VIV65_11945 [Gemmatimonadaceae bacterium]|jgi:hypothetical protein